MSYTVKSNESTTIRGNIAFASGTWAAGGTHTKPETIVTGLGKLIFGHVQISNTTGSANQTLSVDIEYQINETKNGTAADGSIGITECNGSGDSGNFFAMGYID